MLEPIEVLGKKIEVKLVRAQIRNSYARVRGDYLVIRLPERMGNARALKTAEELHGRMVKALQKDPHRFLGMPDIAFNDKDTITILGERFPINILQTSSQNVTMKFFNGALYVKAPFFAQKERIDKSIRKFLEKNYAGKLSEIINELNSKHFRSDIGVIRLRDNLSTWGSCARNNDITLNFRLLYAPPQILEYVIVHELAHTKIRNHSKRFWNAVAAVLPDYKERRRWLRKSSHELKPTFNS